MDGWGMNRWWINELMDGWIDEWIDGWIDRRCMNEMVEPWLCSWQCSSLK